MNVADVEPPATAERASTRTPRIIGGRSVGVPAGQVARYAVQKLRTAQPAWAATPPNDRLEVIERFRRLVAKNPDRLTAAVTSPVRRDAAETLSAEVLPLCEACRFLERNAEELLEPKRRGNRGRPAWLYGVKLTDRREPHGVVLVLGTWNYPLFLTGTQTLQALVAGNAVLVKPGRGSRAAAAVLRDLLLEAGLPPGVLAVLGEEPEAGRAAVNAGVNKVVLTGSASTGRAVLADCADSLTPAAMELSGCDAAFVLEGADVTLAAKCLALSLTWNGSATCVAARRVFVHRSLADELRGELVERVSTVAPVPCERNAAATAEELIEEALNLGATRLCGTIDHRPDPPRAMPVVLADVPGRASILKTDLFAPVLSLIEVGGEDEARARDNCCPYALGATVFGPPRAARRLAEKLDAGCVVINDFLIPTADPRVSFGGRGESGFGVTRGPAGLLEMTRPKAVLEQVSSWRPHLDPPEGDQAEFFKTYLLAAHADGLGNRLKHGWAFVKECFARNRNASAGATNVPDA
ncbi:aldehyde dehydrogenase family protein [Alienimonas sp. DA493]|uniref:aldehyde dehydrogenase family protein n=1 Tax=Alienimonas sp. DA493 TaxID=3373605 RepID=UPI00375437A5